MIDCRAYRITKKYSAVKYTALSFKIWLDFQKEFYFIGKMFIFAHNDAEAPPTVFLFHRY